MTSTNKHAKKLTANKAVKAPRSVSPLKSRTRGKANLRGRGVGVVGGDDRQRDALSPNQIAAPMLDSRLPPIGTTLVKRDRRGAVRCECTIEPDGIRYAGTLYPSLSAAASAAAKDLGLKAAVNGFSFFQIIKANRPAMSRSDRLRRIGERYEERAREYLATMTADTDEALHVELNKHLTNVRQLVEKYAG